MQFLHKLKKLIQGIVTSEIGYKLIVKRYTKEGFLRTNMGFICIENVTKFIQSLLFFGFYEKKEKQIVSKYLPSEYDVIEAGASLGYISLTIAKKVQYNKQIVIIDANPNVYDNLKKTFIANAIENVHIVNSALDYSGISEIQFMVDPNNLGSKIATAKDSVKVNTVTLENIAIKSNIENFCFVCDIEGAEYQLIDGVDKVWFKRHCKKVIMEVHNSPSNLPYDRKKLLNFFTNDLHFELEYESGDVWVLNKH